MQILIEKKKLNPGQIMAMRKISLIISKIMSQCGGKKRNKETTFCIMKPGFRLFALWIYFQGN